MKFVLSVNNSSCLHDLGVSERFTKDFTDNFQPTSVSVYYVEIKAQVLGNRVALYQTMVKLQVKIVSFISKDHFTSVIIVVRG